MTTRVPRPLRERYADLIDWKAVDRKVNAHLRDLDAIVAHRKSISPKKGPVLSETEIDSTRPLESTQLGANSRCLLTPRQKRLLEDLGKPLTF